MKRIILLLSISFIVLLAKGQGFSDSLYLHLYNYQVIKGELKANFGFDKLSRHFNIEPLIDSTNTEALSIFKFYHLEYDEPLTSILIVEKDNIEIYDLLSFDALIEKILNASVNEKFKKSWITEVLRMLRSYYEIVDLEKLVVQKDFGKYHYFIPLTNLKHKEGILK